MRPLSPLLALALVGCATATVDLKPDAGPGTAGTDAPSTTPTTPPSTSTSTDDPTLADTGDTGLPITDTGTTTAADPIIRFVALGDAGEANDAQYAVSDAIETVCDLEGCDFALYLGDNFYDTGVDSANDPMFQTHFEDVYANLDFPFYITLGNHDLGLEGLGVEFWKGQYYVDYTLQSTKWVMPDTHYTVRKDHLQIFSLNTTDIFFGFGGDQETWLANELPQVPADVDWVIGFGHHPYISNGQHGNAGEYEGLDPIIPFTEIPRGEYVQEFFDANVCGYFDLYISGHDHNRQMLEPACGTNFIVSGSGAKTTDLVGRGNPTLFEDDTTEGFLWVELDGRTFTGVFYDRDGNEDYRVTWTK